ncbi:hypothetical protein [uncultured Flavobacterium sp.]|uniref:hypothetical protein n=1 Tax=uncultured Flavobacterium sp. TaxID=165435 RepID=UPI0025DFC1C4|nr:hypothetical protein [uncultured Flavobacterium sp.]
MMKYIAIAIVSAIILTSCALMPREDRMARSGDVVNRFSRTVIVAEDRHKFGIDILKLRKNQTFVFRENFLGVSNSYYSGQYHLVGNVLLLEFAEDRKPAGIDCVMMLTAQNGMPYLKGANRGMYIKTTNDLTEAMKSIQEELQ